jgi:hypothetical protein
MILIKYAIYYLFIGGYETKLAVEKAFKFIGEQLSSSQKSSDNKGEVTSVRSSLLRAAFRSIL